MQRGGGYNLWFYSRYKYFYLYATRDGDINENLIHEHRLKFREILILCENFT